MASRCLIIFTRYPEPGRAKTRLIPELGGRTAAILQRRMTENLCAWARALASKSPLHLEVRFEDALKRCDRVMNWLGPGMSYLPQASGGLGRRMHQALSAALDRGHERAVLVGCDAPGLDAEIMSRAFNSLKRADLVLGPALDGGYYLIGLTRPQPELFRDLPWGAGNVLALTLKRAGRLGLKTVLLPELGDVDRPEDIIYWRKRKASPGLISVIIPTLNEAGNLPACLDALAGAVNVEIIVADGGSDDATIRIARDRGAEVISPGRGRGLQMRAGADEAKGQSLVFLHADTRLSPGWESRVRLLLDEPGVSLGAFSFALDEKSPGLRLVEIMVDLRSRFLHLPYGDQALFIRAELLARLGGFPAQPLMEDVELVRMARKRGGVAISGLKAVSSARRWREAGTLGNTLRNWLTYLRYLLGASPQALARSYYRKR